MSDSTQAISTPPAAAPPVGQPAAAPSAAAASLPEASAPLATPPSAITVPPANAPPQADVDIRLPQGFEADSILLGEFKPLAKELGLGSDSAQKLVDLYAKAQTLASEKSLAGWEQQQKSWKDALASDKDFGGAQLEQSRGHVAKVMAKFGTPALAQYLDQTGLGNHPEMVRAFVKLGKAMAEDSSAVPTAPSASGDREAALRMMFPTHFPVEK